jgi:hypothetical protein
MGIASLNPFYELGGKQALPIAPFQDGPLGGTSREKLDSRALDLYLKGTGCKGGILGGGASCR